MKKLALALAVAMAIPLSAQAWTPEKDVSVIVAYKAGSGTDTGARLLMTLTEKEIPTSNTIKTAVASDKNLRRGKRAIPANETAVSANAGAT